MGVRAATAAPRALVVDDSRATRRIIAGILHELGFETREAENGREALEVLDASEMIDLAVVDWNMPVVDGLQFVVAVRAARRFDAVKLVMVSTEVERHKLVRALDAGADEYVMKPFTRDMLLSKLALVGLCR